MTPSERRLICLAVAVIAATVLVFGILFITFTPEKPLVIGLIGGGYPTASATPELTPAHLPNPSPVPTPAPSPTGTPTTTRVQMPAVAPGLRTGVEPPTLADYWEGRAEFVAEVRDTGLPMGESDTLVMPGGEMWSYVHASQRSAGALDRCGNPVEFPGCVVIYRSRDAGRTFQHDQPPVCLFECQRCPCDSPADHVDQQQYPRVYRDGDTYLMVYEYRARVMLRRSADGLAWSKPEELPFSGVWPETLRGCPQAERIGTHPYVTHEYDCLAGGPPGLYLEDGWLYVFVAVGQSPGGMGCYYGGVDQQAPTLRKCRYYPLFTGATEYGPLKATGRQTNPFFDFRTISSADVQRIGSHYYMVYEGIRGPGARDPGDSQFGLGLARSQATWIDGPWEKYPANPILADLPGNIGLGHADLVLFEGRTLLYTSLDGKVRSRLALAWKGEQ